MIKFSREVDYALTLITFIATNKSKQQYTSLQAIATQKHLPYKFLSQVAHKLKSAQLIDSKEGAGGGYRLSKSASKITLKTIIEAIDGPIALTACQQGHTCLCQSTCLHRTVVDQLASSMSGQLDSIRVSDLINQPTT